MLWEELKRVELVLRAAFPYVELQHGAVRGRCLRGAHWLCTSVWYLGFFWGIDDHTLITGFSESRIMHTDWGSFLPFLTKCSPPLFHPAGFGDHTVGNSNERLKMTEVQQWERAMWFIRNANVVFRRHKKGINNSSQKEKTFWECF